MENKIYTKKVLKIKIVSCILVVFSFMLVGAYFILLPAIFGGQYAPWFKTPFQCPGSCWRSSDQKVEFFIDEDFESVSSPTPIVFLIDGEEVTYYMRIHGPARFVEIFRDQNKSSLVLSGGFKSRFHKFTIQIHECDDDFFADYDEIVFYKK